MSKLDVAKSKLVWFFQNSLQGHGIPWSDELVKDVHEIVDSIIEASTPVAEETTPEKIEKISGGPSKEEQNSKKKQ